MTWTVFWCLNQPVITHAQDKGVQSLEGEVAANVTGSDFQANFSVLRPDDKSSDPGRFPIEVLQLSVLLWRPFGETDMSRPPGQQEPGPKFELKFTLSLLFPERMSPVVLRDLGDITKVRFFSSWSHLLDGSEAPALVLISRDSWRASPGSHRSAPAPVSDSAPALFPPPCRSVTGKLASVDLAPKIHSG